MTNSYGFNGDIPAAAIAGVYDSENGEWTGMFYFSFEEAEAAEKENALSKEEALEEVNNSGWVGSK